MSHTADHRQNQPSSYDDNYRSNEKDLSFANCIKYYWRDYLSMCLAGILGIVLYILPPAPNRVFPVKFADGEVVYPEFAYPLLKNIIPIWLAALLGFFVPLFAISLCQLKRKSILDWNAALLGLLYSLVTAALFQVFIKYLIGGLRPHFYAVCKPQLPANLALSGSGYDGIMVDRSVCTGDQKEINDSLESMPSGHSTCAFAGFIYCALYLNAHLKIFAFARPAYWKYVSFFAPILCACLIAGSLTIDEFHHWYDVLAGSVIGTLTAFTAYRSHFAAIWDPRRNHIVLPRDSDANGNIASQTSLNDNEGGPRLP